MNIRLICMVLMCLLGVISPMQAQTFEQLWKQVEQAQKKGLPLSAIRITEQIFSKGEKEKKAPQMLKAYVWRMQLQGVLTPDSFYVDLKGLEQWALRSNDGVERAVLHSLLAGYYADYADYNNYLLSRRTNIEGEDFSDDIREWTAGQFALKVRSHVQAALADSLLLLTSSSRSYVPWTVLGESSEYYHHDWYHLLASRALHSLQQMLDVERLQQTEAVYPFGFKKEIDRLYQSVLAAYQAKGMKAACLLLNLQYVEWKRSNDMYAPLNFLPKGLLGLAQDPYLADLNRLRAEFQSEDVCAEVYRAQASYALSKRQPFAAKQIAEEAIQRYPHYERINELKNLLKDIEKPHFYVSVSEEAYPESEVSLSVNHKNVDGFTVKVLSDKKVVAQQEYALVRPKDYLAQDTVVKFRMPVCGVYKMVVFPHPQAKENAEAQLLVSRMKLLTAFLSQNQCEVLTLDRKSGLPIVGAEVTLYDKDKQPSAVFTSNEQGRVVFPWKDCYHWVKASKGEDKGMDFMSVSRGRGGFSYVRGYEPQEEMTLLTDRSLYRPGQTVYVKGIAYQQLADTAHVQVGKSYTLTLWDANRQEVARQEVRTNDFGSFATTFTLPSACLNGDFMIRADRFITSIRVEEYKRPTFDVTFNPPSTDYRIGDQVQLSGSIRSFSGAQLADVPVKYTVQRVEYAYWRPMDSKQIASGEVKADDNGQFVVPVSLEGEDCNSQHESVYYHYQVEATVTSVAGETQSAMYSLAAGYRSLVLQTDLKKRTLKENLSGVNGKKTVVFKVHNLNGQPVSVTGEYAVFQAHPETFEVSGDCPLLTGAFTSNQQTVVDWQSLPSGAYVLKASVCDAKGQEVKCEDYTVLFSLSDSCPPVPTKSWLYEHHTEFDEQHPAVFYYGTSEKDAYVLMHVFSGQRLIETKTFHLSDTIQCFTYPYQEEYGDGLLVSMVMVKDGVVYRENVELKKRMPAKTLKMKWTVFRDKLRPGQQEEWKLTLYTPQGRTADAEMLGLMYDASLDKLWKRSQSFRPYYFRRLPFFYWNADYQGETRYSFWWDVDYLRVPALMYDHFASSLFRFAEWREAVIVGFNANPRKLTTGAVPTMSMKSRNGVDGATAELKYVPVQVSDQELTDVVFESESIPIGAGSSIEEGETSDAHLSESADNLRSILTETAFFYPQLHTNEQGEVVLSFTMPESLTRWKFCGYAHTKGMLTGMVEEEVTTSKEFMLTPNLPRFVREGDETTVAAAVSNQTGVAQRGTVRFVLFDPLTEKVIHSQKQSFAVEAGKQASVVFRFTATDKYGLLGCRLVADSDQFSDGEQQLLPVLSSKMHVVEALPMPIRGEESRTFSLQSLFNQHSSSAVNRHLTVEFTGNPAWYAVQALPSLAMPAEQNAISWATAYYANALAAYILNSQPRVKAVLDNWKLQGGTKETLWSNLQKNQDLKNLLLAESPWVLEAQTEAQQKERLATLLDLNHVRNQHITALTHLQELQHADGAWSWFKGMQGSPTVTLYIAELNARLALLTGQSLSGEALQLQQKALLYLHQTVLKEYTDWQKARQRGVKASGLSMFSLRYLYVVALTGTPVPETNKEAYTYYLSQVKELLPSASMSAKAMAAVVLEKNGQSREAAAFVASLKEHLTQTDEQGLFFAFNEMPIVWGEWPVRVHVDVMEALATVGGHAEELEEMKMWLLKQKQTQLWNSPISTADAVYALLMNGTNLLDGQGNVRMEIGNEVLHTAPDGQEAAYGLGYVKQDYTQKTVVNAQNIRVEKATPGVAWGAVYASYDTPVNDVKQQTGGWQVEKKWYVEHTEGKATKLLPLDEDRSLKVGDKVVVRITVRTDRVTDFVQLKDQRAACLEPLESLSGYHWNEGMGYYVDIKDASTHYFFDTLGKGVFVLESVYRVSRTGVYEGGVVSIQSAYAPEYASHSDSRKVVVEK
ncbi:alpha-2-macroglobulin family protein [gut metagenome]|uniref:Alpha-2-macroglobulin family protein n=1 Tax=gut metagenome TaxID=749906 RepID=J9GFU3_9ZZZZ